MTAFSATLALKKGVMSFSFSEILRADSSKFYVSVQERHRSILAFEMKKHTYKDHWVVCPPVPDWIVEEEATFSNLITRQKKGQLQRA